MKKLLACLLALLLPCCALAETISLDWSMNVSPDGLALLLDMVQDSLDAEISGLSDSMIEAVAELLSGFSFGMIVNTTGDRYVFSMAYQDLELLTFDGQDIGDSMYAVCNLTPGYLLISPGNPELQIATEESTKTLSTIWPDLAQRLATYWPAWTASLDMTAEYGAFAGDAYVGVGRCRTYRFDERDVAVLLESMLNADRSDSVDTLLQYLGLLLWDDANGMVNYLRDSILTAARTNRYRYVLRVVDSGVDETPIGLSLLVYEADQQVSTLSVGFPEKGLDAVLGYGLRGRNYYLSLTMNNTPDKADQLTLRLWQDPQKAGYSTVSDNQDANLLLTADVSATSEHLGRVATLRTVMNGKALGNHQLETVISLTSSAIREELSTSVKVDSADLLTSSLVAEYVADLPALEMDGLRVIDINDMTDSEAALITEIAEDAGMELGIQLFKLLPPELLAFFLTTGVF